jgi:hypothetical protein
MRNQQQQRSACYLLSRWFLVWIIRPWTWGRNILPKHLLTSNILHGVMFQKTELFMNTGVRTSNPKKLFVIMTRFISGARGSVVDWGTMLQAGRSPVRVPDEVDIFSLPNLSSRTMTLRSTQPLTEMSNRKFSGGKGGQRLWLTTLPPSVNRMFENVGASTSHRPKALHGLQRDNFVFTFSLTYTIYFCVFLRGRVNFIEYVKQHLTLHE